MTLLDRPASKAWLIILPAALAAAALLYYWRAGLDQPARSYTPPPPPVTPLQLALGQEARTRAPLSIPIQPPAELDRLSRAEVLELRRREVERHGVLMRAPYKPVMAVFGGIVDRRPWWGIVGQFYIGPGPNSIEGPSEETRLVLNPFLLVAPEFFGLTLWVRGAGMWRAQSLSRDQLHDPDFPFYVPARELTWRPHERRAEVRYPVSKHLARLNRYTTSELRLEHATFDLFAYNARDLGLSHLLLSPLLSRNLLKRPPPPAQPVPIRHFIHLGSSCGYPGGCNNMSPQTPELNGYVISALPARAHLLLWSQPPSKDQPPDLSFVIHFE